MTVRGINTPTVLLGSVPVMIGQSTFRDDGEFDQRTYNLWSVTEVD